MFFLGSTNDPEPQKESSAQTTEHKKHPLSGKSSANLHFFFILELLYSPTIAIVSR